MASKSPAVSEKAPAVAVPSMADLQAVGAKMKPYLQKVGPAMKVVKGLYDQHSPMAFELYEKAAKVVDPTMLYALVLIFFGGSYALTLCAYNAFQVSGGHLIKRSWNDLKVSYHEAIVNLQESEKGKAQKDKVFDADGDGEITASELFTAVYEATQPAAKAAEDEKRQKVFAGILSAVDPTIILEAFTGLWTGIAAVLAAMRLQVARYVTVGTQLGVRVASMVQERTAAEAKAKYPQYAKWIDSGYQSAGAILGIFIAYLITKYVMAVNSAVEGGNIIAKLAKDDKSPLHKFLHDKPDHIIAYGLAGLGIAFQFYYDFSMPWFLFMLCPLGIVESALMVVAVAP